ncbi:hypothetical protein EV182_001140 [Spiromyces aspiralis]|uniref:Uncharacterized protein n=1 Tax=Spiromyces aspiralis TaxID=68401 RepID=A0ACC1HVU5_9FUNG|nr:hypothetical protein EV182_001140 [Spiromyces aspiralis]
MFSAIRYLGLYMVSVIIASCIFPGMLAIAALPASIPFGFDLNNPNPQCRATLEQIDRHMPNLQSCVSSGMLFTANIGTVCSKNCQQPIVQASANITASCADALTSGDAKRYGVYRSWSNPALVDWACSKDPVSGSNCFDTLFTASTTWQLNKQGLDRSICSPCIKKWLSLAKDAPDNTPVLYYGDVQDYAGLYRGLASICTCSK